MHPLLSRNRLGFYLLSWIPLAVILVYVMAAGGILSLLESSIIVIPLCVLYAFICLSAWYTAKSASLKRESALRLIVIHSVAAALVSYFWMGLGWVLVAALSRTSTFQGLDHRFSRQAAILFAAGYLLYLISVASQYVIISLEASREAEARALETSILAREAELKALKAQVNPHFLFNSLNSINALTSVDPAKAREMCILLSEFLRMTLGLGERTVIPLSEELALLDRFLAIEKVRFGARLRVEENIQKESKTVLVPPLVLQPLVENAVVHGIANLPEGGVIRLASQCHDGRLSMTIENTFDPESTPVRRKGMGLSNVRSRLECRYGTDASMRVDPQAHQFRVELSMPAEAGDARN
ncbi:MAG: sensor histidine kinase [Acidobacteria bacterium]|nr:MAG: sensor histidine kinase [Acidobacteriota bacterium]